MAVAQVSWDKRRGFGQTMRRDRWWQTPLLVFIGLGAFVVYTTWAAFQGKNYYWGPYLSPFYSPEIFGSSPNALLGPMPAWWPGWLPFSPALIILPFPALFRLTCYYYRGAYYKAFWADPPSCAVGEPRKSYLGERHFPLILFNVHRYFLYIAFIFLVILGHDAWDAMWFPNAAGGTSFGIGLGTLILTANVILLGGYTFGCHSLRHLVGGRFDRISAFRRKSYDCVTCLNGRHQLWAWMSLFMVAISDIYIRLGASGVIRDWRIF
jgi:hypothetical protein